MRRQPGPARVGDEKLGRMHLARPADIGAGVVRAVAEVFPAARLVARASAALDRVIALARLHLEAFALRADADPAEAAVLDRVG